LAAGGALSARADRPLPEPHSDRAFERGTQVFRLILFSLGLQPVQRLDELNDDPPHTALIVLGDTNVLDEMGEVPLKQYLNRGGTMLLATDRKTTGLVESVFGIGISGWHVETFARDEQYQHNVDCPIITGENIDHGDGKRRQEYPFLRGIQKVVTNRPSYFALPGRRSDRTSHQQEVLWFPSGCVCGSHGPRPSTLVLGMVSLDYSSPVLLLADHSLFINSMLLQPDLWRDDANYGFTGNCVNWLTENGKRKRVLLLDEGEVVQSFVVPPGEVPGMTPKQLNRLPVPSAEVVNHLVRAWEDENIFNRLLLEHVPLSRILRGLVVALTALLVGYGLFRLWRARHDAELGR
jgi:hypothetical protein